MSRLLFAAARGARIERSHFKYPYAWEPSRIIWVTDLDNTDCDYDYRIHPKDEALQYGPISTALRKIGLTGTCDDVDIPYVKPALLLEDGYGESTEEQRRVFCLILAEALADSGL
jgi:hypothetical protein